MLKPLWILCFACAVHHAGNWWDSSGVLLLALTMATKREDPIDDVNRVLTLCNVFRTVMDSLYIKVSISCYNKGSPGSPLMQFVFFFRPSGTFQKCLSCSARVFHGVARVDPKKLDPGRCSGRFPLWGADAWPNLNVSPRICQVYLVYLSILVYLMFLDWNMNMSAALFTDLGDTRWYKYLVKRSPKIKRSHHNRQLFEKSEYDLRSVEIFSSYGISRYITVYTSLLWTLWWPCVHNHVTILVAPVGGFTAT